MFSGFTPPPLEAEDPLKTRCVPVSTVWPGTKKVLTGLKSKCIRLGRGNPEVAHWTEETRSGQKRLVSPATHGVPEDLGLIKDPRSCSNRLGEEGHV